MPFSPFSLHCIGYGEGAFGALSGAWALKELGVNVQSIHVGATPVNWFTTISKFAGTYLSSKGRGVSSLHLSA